LLKTQPGASAWIAFGFGIAMGKAVEGHRGDLTLLTGVTSVCATFEGVETGCIVFLEGRATMEIESAFSS
jgi:hypothetical protein